MNAFRIRQTPLFEQKHLWNAVYICGSEQVSEYLI